MMLKHAELYCTFPCSTSVRKYVHVLYFNWKVLRIKRPVSDNSCRTLEISKFFSFILFSTLFRHQGLFMMIVQKYCALKEKELRPSRGSVVTVSDVLVGERVAYTRVLYQRAFRILRA